MKSMKIAATSVTMTAAMITTQKDLDRDTSTNLFSGLSNVNNFINNVYHHNEGLGKNVDSNILFTEKVESSEGINTPPHKVGPSSLQQTNSKTETEAGKWTYKIPIRKEEDVGFGIGTFALASEGLADAGAFMNLPASQNPHPRMRYSPGNNILQQLDSMQHRSAFPQPNKPEGMMHLMQQNSENAETFGNNDYGFLDSSIVKEYKMPQTHTMSTLNKALAKLWDGIDDAKFENSELQMLTHFVQKRRAAAAVSVQRAKKARRRYMKQASLVELDSTKQSEEDLFFDEAENKLGQMRSGIIEWQKEHGLEVDENHDMPEKINLNGFKSPPQSLVEMERLNAIPMSGAMGAAMKNLGFSQHMKQWPVRENKVKKTHRKKAMKLHQKVDLDEETPAFDQSEKAQLVKFDATSNLTEVQGPEVIDVPEIVEEGNPEVEEAVDKVKVALNLKKDSDTVKKDGPEDYKALASLSSDELTDIAIMRGDVGEIKMSGAPAQGIAGSVQQNPQAVPAGVNEKDMTKCFMVFGMYNSATMLLTELIRANFPAMNCPSTAEQECGPSGCVWKHIHPQALEAQQNWTGVYIFTVRDPVNQMRTWSDISDQTKQCFKPAPVTEQCTEQQRIGANCEFCTAMTTNHTFKSGISGVWNDYTATYNKIHDDMVAKGKQNTMMVQYEKLLADPKAELLRIGEKLGYSADDMVSPPELLQGTSNGGIRENALNKLTQKRGLGFSSDNSKFDLKIPKICKHLHYATAFPNNQFSIDGKTFRYGQECIDRGIPDENQGMFDRLMLSKDKYVENERGSAVSVGVLGSLVMAALSLLV